MDLYYSHARGSGSWILASDQRGEDSRFEFSSLKYGDTKDRFTGKPGILYAVCFLRGEYFLIDSVISFISKKGGHGTMVLKIFFPVFIFILLYSVPCLAQSKWEWPDHPKNIKVLPTDVTAEQLRSSMHEFTSGLGVRCNYCHKGAEGKPFSEWDFASDEKPDKDRAREMMRMLHDIDDHLAKIKPSGDTKVNVTCYTCHRGRPRPMTLYGEISEVYRKEGLEPAMMHLSELKKEYYGKGVFNFESDQVLNEFGQSLLDSSKTDEALRVLKLNVEKFPQSSSAWSSLAAAYVQSGNKPEAIKSCEKSLELDPRNRNAKKILDDLKE